MNNAFSRSRRTLPGLATLLLLASGAQAQTPDSAKPAAPAPLIPPASGVSPATGTYSAGAGLQLSNSNVFSIKSLGVVTSMIAKGAVTGPKIAVPLSLTSSSSSAILSAANSGGGSGLFGSSSGTDGITGVSTAANRSGVYGQDTASNANGVSGQAGSSGNGVYGYSSSSGTGVAGNSDSGTAVYGLSNSGVGVYGQTSSGNAITAYVTSTSGGNGVYGQTVGAYSSGVAGVNMNGGAGVSGTGIYGVVGTGLFGVYGSGSGNGSIGVEGDVDDSSGSIAVYGNDHGGEFGEIAGTSDYRGYPFGVYGNSGGDSNGRGDGVIGVCPASQGTGVYGDSQTGVYGYSDAPAGVGVVGQAEGSNSGGIPIGVYGINSNDKGDAGYFQGNVYVNGTLSASTKDFKIDHPLDPQNKYLIHASVESDQMEDIYSGNVTTDGRGNATVKMPDWFEALNGDFRYQLTVIGQFAQAIVGTEITGGQFVIKTDKPNVRVSWQVTGVRHDAFARAHPLVVEEDKPDEAKGTYLDPADFGQPKSKGQNYARLAALRASHAGTGTAAPATR